MASQRVDEVGKGELDDVKHRPCAVRATDEIRTVLPSSLGLHSIPILLLMSVSNVQTTHNV